LVQLLTTGAHHDAATPVTLAAVGDTRRALDTEHGQVDVPGGRCVCDVERLAAQSVNHPGFGRDSLFEAALA